jgi:amino acid transporter
MEESTMPVLVFFIILSLVLYFFYKTKYFRSQKPVEKKWLAAKSSIALGVFVGLFGINQLFLFSTTVTYIVSSIFIIIGFLSAINGFKRYRYYLPFVEKEAEEWGKN